MNIKSGGEHRGSRRFGVAGRSLLIAMVAITVGLTSTGSALAAAGQTIIFRSDDAEAYFGLDLLRTITDTLISNGVPQTVGVIPSHPSGDVLGDDPAMVAYLNTIKANPLVELALHGYTHSSYEFDSLTQAQAESRIDSGLAVMNQYLGMKPVTFIPPYNAFSTGTPAACKSRGLTRFSAATFSDTAAWTESPAGLLHVPSVVDFQDWSLGGTVRSASSIINESQAYLDSKGVVVILIHFWSFGDDNGNLNPAAYQTLLDVISWVRTKQAQGTKLATIAQYGQSTTPPVPDPVPVITSRIVKSTVAANTSDAYEMNGKMFTTQTVAVAGIQGTNVYRAGFRFATVKLPKGAQITSARLLVSYNLASAMLTGSTLYGEASNASKVFGTTAKNLSLRVRTVASVGWSQTAVSAWGQTVTSPDIAPIVQEIVSRSGWVTGGPVTILQYENPSVNGTWESASFESGSPYAARLEIEYLP